MTATIVWFRNDLRLADNPALDAACAEGGEILPVFILDESIGGASKWWLHHSLRSLSESLADAGAKLVLRRGDPRDIIPELAKAAGAKAVHAARSHEPAMRALDRDAAAALKDDGVAFQRHLSQSLFAPERITNKTGGVYGVYTPFSRACFEAGVQGALLPAPEKIAGIDGIESEALEDWKLLPTKPDWAGGLREAWQPGEAGGAKRLQDFRETALTKYADKRNFPGIAGTSGLSPHLHFGEISARTVWQKAAADASGKGIETYLKEILWREFSIYLLWHNPDLAQKPIRAAFADFPWVEDKAGLRAWQRGRTGIPIVDAGMRQLWQTGWMHNRVRMITASFLVKHLLIPWTVGEAWFFDTLVDADLAANAASWQWVAGCGADAAPYFRVFNPVLQGRKFDADGAYVRRYVPELAGLPDEHLHAPWEADEKTLAAAGLKLGKTYPAPIISLSEGRERALAAYERIKQ